MTTTPSDPCDLHVFVIQHPADEENWMVPYMEIVTKAGGYINPRRYGLWADWLPLYRPHLEDYRRVFFHVGPTCADPAAAITWMSRSLRNVPRQN